MVNWTLGAAIALAALAADHEPPDREQVLHIPAELRTHFHEQVIRHGRTPAHRFELMVDFLFGDDGLAFVYDDEVTRTIEQTYRSRKGNCLSFTLLFVALAREAGLNAHVQEVDRVLVWYRDGDVVFNSRHANAGVRLFGRRHTVDFDRTVTTPRNRPRRVSDERALAHFYNNRGAELLATEQLAAARGYFEKGIELDPSYAATWNNLGVMHLRLEDFVAAEQSFLTALQYEPDHALTLANLADLYEELGRTDLIAEFQQRLDEVRHNDPFHQYLLALEHEEQGDYEAAVGHFRRAIHLHYDEHEFHFGLARVYHRLGRDRQAERSLQRAYRLGDADARSVYEAKLRSIGA